MTDCLDTDLLVETSLVLSQIVFNCLRKIVIKEILFIFEIPTSVEIIPVINVTLSHWKTSNMITNNFDFNYVLILFS